jgi:hypothetical protein
MASPAPPSFAAVFLTAYWDLFTACRALWRLALIATLIFITVQGAGVIGPRLLLRAPLAQELLRLGITLAGLALVAPFLIAVQRLILLGEVTHRYAIEPSHPRFQLFAGWLMMFGLIASMPALLFAAATSTGPIYYVGQPSAPTPDLMQVLTSRLWILAVIAFLSRVIALLPAVAVDARGAIWQNAVLDTKGSGLFIATASIWTILPLFVLIAPILLLLRLVDSHSLVGAFAPLCVVLGALFLAIVLIGLIAARLYQALGERLNQSTASTAV